MRLPRLSCAVTVALCSLTVHVPGVRADNTTCANAEYLFPGEVADDGVSANGSIYFKTAVVEGRSYSIAAWAPFADRSEVSGGPIVDMDLFTDDTCAIGAVGVSVFDSEPDPDVSSHSGDRDTIVPSFSGTLWIRIDNFQNTSYTVHVRVVETTMFSPWWFVGGTNQAFAEIRNNTNNDVPLNATFFGSDGTECGSTGVTLPANGNTAIGVKLLGTCATAVSGSAQIAFQGAPGGLAANITTIDGMQGTSFDSPFTPRMVWGGWKRSASGLSTQ